MNPYEPQPPPSYGERADLIQSEFDGRAPKLRLSIFAYMVEAGIKPKDIKTSEAFMELLAHVTEYVSGDVADYVKHVRGMAPTTSALEVLQFDDDDEDADNPYGPGGGGYE